MFDKSFYDLTFGVAPGGARKDAHFISATLDEVKEDLASELAEEINLYLMCWYGARLSLDVYQQGELAESIDLHPFITISIQGYPDITFAGPGEPIGYDFEADEGEEGDDEADDEADDEEDDEEEENEADSLSERMFAGDLGDKVTVSVDWARTHVPPLTGEVVGPDDTVQLALRSGYRPLASYGFSDFEM
ncbi:hypothetical protein [Streptomyces inhibens]|uniref:hypothetical protein n=1 Tax=Streptomyces inhibens TaxID=2293571 RepID=UPI001EE6BAB3|nr:hypothetical protein [Streptomyces inhibens]UKY54929.1 hypothetical protein KI385_43360 [Streptomyces inhibens]